MIDNTEQDTEAPASSEAGTNEREHANDGSANSAEDRTPHEAPDADQTEQTDVEDTFDRAYVEDLRKESAGYRTQLRTVQEQLHRALVEQSGRLADPADLAFDPAHLEDPAALAGALDALLQAKPHLKRRALPDGGASLGPQGATSGTVNLADIMRAGL